MPSAKLNRDHAQDAAPAFGPDGMRFPEGSPRHILE